MCVGRALEQNWPKLLGRQPVYMNQKPQTGLGLRSFPTVRVPEVLSKHALVCKYKYT